MLKNALSPLPTDKVDSVAIRVLTSLTSLSEPKLEAPSMRLADTAPYFVKQLYDASISNDRLKTIAVIADLQAANVSIDEIISTLVPETARRLGQDWVDDNASFGTVTIGCARLQAGVHHLERSFAERPLKESPLQNSCLVVAPKNAQHTLGAVVLAAQLRQAGSHVHVALDVSENMMSQLMNADRYDAVMISASLGQDLNDLRSLIRASRQPKTDPKLIIGGSICNECVDLKTATEADYITSNWQEALNLGVQGLQDSLVAL